MSQSGDGQAFIKNVLERPQTYINFEVLADELVNGNDIMKCKADDLIDTERLIGDIKKG